MILLASPRSGSGFVSNNLTAAGYGVMREWMFKKQHYKGKITLDSVHSIISTTIQTQMRGRKIFSAKIMWNDLFNGLLPILPYEVWPEWFGETHFLTIEREDKLSQIASFHKALVDDKWFTRKKQEAENITFDEIVEIYGDSTIPQILSGTIWAVYMQTERGKKWITDNKIPIVKNLRYSSLQKDVEDTLKILKKRDVPSLEIPMEVKHMIPVKQRNNVNSLLKEYIKEMLSVTEEEFNALSLKELREYINVFKDNDNTITFGDFLVNRS